MTLRPIDGACGEIFFQRRTKYSISLPPGVQMHPNKFWCAWLGQGCGLKVVWKGFGRSIKMKENFADLIFQNFCSKRLKIDRFCVRLCCGIFPISGTTLAHTTGKNSMRYAFWRVPHTQRPLEACEPAPFTLKTRRLWGKVSIEVRGGSNPVKVHHARVN